ncbi:MAG: SH3 domain-containing protein [Pseudomonadota bacterium]
MIRRLLIAALLALAPLATPAFADEPIQVTVADAFLELHTGPGKGYPIDYVVERDESVVILMRRTNWFKVRTENGREGWVRERDMELTLDAYGEPVRFRSVSRTEFMTSRWEVGALTGDFGGANIVNAYAGYSMSGNLSVELAFSQVLGNFSNGYIGSANLVHQTWPEWRVSPFFTLGTGVIRTEPKSTLVAADDRTDQFAQVGGGFRAWLTRRLIFRAEYKSYVIFTSQDENEEIEEWKIGFGFFF